jgi:predicted membrane chloride channel (bestrophin family)
MPKSLVLRGLASQAFSVGLFAAGIVVYNMLVEIKILSHFPLLSLPALPFSLTSSALSLLLVFRTNAAYSRWKGARIAWGIISARSYDLIRQTASWIKRDDLRVSIVQFASAYSRCLKWELTHKGNEKNFVDDLSGILTKNEIDKISSSRYRSQRILTMITELLGLSDMPPNVLTHIDRGVCEITSAASTCDRIYSTPIPLVYTRHTARFLLIWLLTVPVALYHEFSFNQKWMVPIIAFLNSIFLFGIEELGVQIEEPFSILPLANICLDIQRVGEEALNLANWPRKQTESVAAAAVTNLDFDVNARNVTSFGLLKSDYEIVVGDFNSTIQLS